MSRSVKPQLLRNQQQQNLTAAIRARAALQEVVRQLGASMGSKSLILKAGLAAALFMIGSAVYKNAPQAIPAAINLLLSSPDVMTHVALNDKTLQAIVSSQPFQAKIKKAIDANVAESIFNNNSVTADYLVVLKKYVSLAIAGGLFVFVLIRLLKKFKVNLLGGLLKASEESENDLVLHNDDEKDDDVEFDASKVEPVKQSSSVKQSNQVKEASPKKVAPESKQTSPVGSDVVVIVDPYENFTAEEKRKIHEIESELIKQKILKKEDRQTFINLANEIKIIKGDFRWLKLFFGYIVDKTLKPEDFILILKNNAKEKDEKIIEIINNKIFEDIEDIENI